MKAEFKDPIYNFKCFFLMLSLLFKFFCFMIALAMLYSPDETWSTLKPVGFVKLLGIMQS